MASRIVGPRGGAGCRLAHVALTSLVLVTACTRVLGDFSIGVDAGAPEVPDAEHGGVTDGSGAAPESNSGDDSGADSSSGSGGGSASGSGSGGGTASDSGSDASGTNGTDGAGADVGSSPDGAGSEAGGASGGGVRDSGSGVGSTNGSDSGASAEAGATTGSGGDSGSSGGDSGACAPGATQCSGASAVQTCGATGQWGTAWQCTSGVCAAGACKGSTATGTSCRTSGPGLTDCGATGENCCTSLQVSGGIYYRSYYSSGGAPIDEADPAIVSGFRLDKYVVTVGRFRQFVNALSPSDGGTGWLPSAGSGKHTHLNGGSGLNATSGGYEVGWLATDDGSIISPNADPNCDVLGPYTTWTPSPSSNESLPMKCANWFDAYAFCIWDGGFLPSEAEWEYAAAGGSQQLEFPWGATSPGADNQYAIYACNYSNASALIGGVGGVSCNAPVGTPTLGAGYWGQLDLVGETFVWNLDWYDAYANPCTDCADVSAASLRVVRGGDSFDNQSPLLPPGRYARNPVAGYGIRCARAP